MTQQPTNNETGELQALGFGFSIPSDATVKGVVVEVKMKSANGNIADFNVQLFSDTATLIGSNQSQNAAVDTSLAYRTYGGRLDAWGASLTPAIVNDNSNFGVSLNFTDSGADTIYVDHVRMTVYFDTVA